MTKSGTRRTKFDPRTIEESVRNIVIPPNYESLVKKKGVYCAGYMLADHIVRLLRRADRRSESRDEIIDYMFKVHDYLNKERLKQLHEQK